MGRCVCKMVDGFAKRKLNLKAIVFPGQGSQYVGMGKTLVERFSSAKELFEEADDILNFKLSKICFDGPEELLKQTSNTQPAIFLHSIAVWNLLKIPDAKMFAGHSLGEYSALVAAEAINFSDALKLVRLRGELMLQAGIEKPGTMAAIIGVENNIVDEVCKEVSKTEIVQSANFNSPGQIVISGSKNGVAIAMSKLKERGARLVKELVVSGAFHSPLMASAREKLDEVLSETKINNITNPVYANVCAKPITNGDEIKKMLSEQLTSPVRWDESIKNMTNNGALNYIEVGPGKVLQGLIKRISANAQISGIDTADELEKFLNA